MVILLLSTIYVYILDLQYIYINPILDLRSEHSVCVCRGSLYMYINHFQLLLKTQ